MQSWAIDESSRAQWNDFVASCEGAPILQTYEWGEVKRSTGWLPVRIAVGEDGIIQGGISILKRKAPGTPFALLYAPRGPVVREGDFKTLQFIFDQLPAIAKQHNALAIKVDPFFREDNTELARFYEKNGFTLQKKQVQPRTTMILDLTHSEDELLASFESKCRYNIRLAEKKGVTVREDNSVEGVDIFHKISKETSTRDEFLIHPRSYYQKVREALVPGGMATLFHTIYQGEPVASVFIFRLGKCLWYMYGASSNAHRNVMPNHALHWHVIRWAKSWGATHYDLWGIPSNPEPDHPLYGVYRFKKGFNGELVKLIGVYDRPFRKILYPIFERGLQLYQNTRSLLTRGRISDSLAE